MTTQKKFVTYFEAPVLNRSGYGLTSDAIFHSLYTYPLFQVTVLPTAWGSCAPRLSPSPYDALIRGSFPKQREIPQPHILVSNTIPYMSKPVGTMFNINYCAGLETDKCPDMFMKGVNQWNLNIVGSNFAKAGYLNSNTKPSCPIEVVNFGVDTNAYKMTSTENPEVERAMAEVKENQCFLFVGQITSPHLFGDRKDMSNLIKTFCETFKGKADKPALIVKTGGTVYSAADRNYTLERIQVVKQMVPNNDVNVYLIHGELNDEEMNALFNHKRIIAHVSFTHSEGYGLPLLQGSLSGKPVIASNWSGHLDFLPEDKAILLKGKVEQIPPYCASEFFLAESKWFNVDYEAAKETLTKFYYGDRTEINVKAQILARQNAKEFSLEAFEKKFHRVMDKYIVGK